MPKISYESSTRLRVLNFPLILGVVYIHSYSLDISVNGIDLGPENVDWLTDFVRIAISQGIARIAVPLFFLMSGFFFYLGFSWSWQQYRYKLLSRAKSLLVPYIFWTTLTVTMIAFGQSITVLRPYFLSSGGGVVNLSLLQLVDAIVGFTRAPEAYHFWFIRDLMVMVVLTPIFYVIISRFFLPYFLVIFLLWISAKWPLYIPDCVGMVFFPLGGYIAFRGKDLFLLDRYGKYFLLGYLPLLLADTYWYEAPFNLCLHRCGIVIGIVAILYLTKTISNNKSQREIMLYLGRASFFVYAAHEPLLGVSRKIAFQMLPVQIPIILLFAYIMVPITVAFGLVAVHALLRRAVPRHLAMITGGR